MKAKGQQNITSEHDANEKLIVYVYEYLVHSGAKQAADLFKENIGYNKEIKVNDGPGFLLDWWQVFWDLYCAAPERRQSQLEASSEARAFHDFMSPSLIAQPSPPQQQPQLLRYAPPPPPPAQSIHQPPLPLSQSHGPRGPPSMDRNMHHQGPPPHQSPYMPASSPRYPHSTSGQPGTMMGSGPVDRVGASPGLNSVGSHQIHAMQPPPRNTSQGSVSSWSGGYNVSSPANQTCYSRPSSNLGVGGGPIQMMGDGTVMDHVGSSPATGGDVSTPHPDEYVMPIPFGQDIRGDPCESAEIMKLKQNMQNETVKQQMDFGLDDYSDPQNKWS